MPNQPPFPRLKSDMPQIPAVSVRFRPVRLVAFLAALIFCLLGLRWLMRPQTPMAAPAAPPPQIDVPAPATDASAALPHATESAPGIANIEQMAQAWAARDFFYKNRASGENVPALVVRLPIGSPGQAAGYWAFSLIAPFGNCRLEYVTNLEKLRTEYGYRAATHPMVGNPCSRTVFDPLKLMGMPGRVWVRGAIVQGSDLRPPLGIEVEVRGRQILAARME